MIAKLFLFSTQLAIIEFFIAAMYNFNHKYNDGDTKHIILCIVWALLVGNCGKYIFGTVLTLIYKKYGEEKNILTLIYSIFMLFSYILLSYWSIYFVSHPVQLIFFFFKYNYFSDNFYNIGCVTVLLALAFDFIILDIIIILILKAISNSKRLLTFLSFGGYLTVK